MFLEPLTSPRLCQYCDYKLHCSLVDKFNKSKLKSNFSSSSSSEGSAQMTSTSSQNTEIMDEEVAFVNYQLTNEMDDFFKQNLSHLEAKHIEYAKRWMNWIFAEWRLAKARGADGRLFREPPLERYGFVILGSFGKRININF